MTVLPLDQLGFGWRSHGSALWWLFLLYRRPKEFQDSLSKLTGRQQLFVGFMVYLHSLPWVVAACAVGRVMLFGSGLVELDPTGESFWTVLGSHAEVIAVGAAVGVGLGVAGGVAGGIAFGIAFEVAYGTTVGIAGGAAIWMAIGVAGGVAGGIAYGVTHGATGGIVVGVAVGIAVGVAVEIAGGAAVGIAGGVVGGIVIPRAYYLPMTGWMVWPQPRGRWYPWHPAAWDQMCAIPFPGLDRLLLAYFEHDPGAARAEVERLIDTYPSQRWQALKAKTAIVARDASEHADLTQLPTVLAALPEGDEGFLRQVPRLRELAAAIAERQQQLDQATYPTVRKQLAELLVQQIESFRDQIGGFEEPLQSEFRKAALAWRDRASGQFAAALGTQTNTTTQLFRAGDPVDREQEAFVYRTAIVAELEQQVFLATGCPGLILYGRRRTGKSTVLRNLTGFLPSSVPVGYVSMQNPQAFASVEGFCRTVAGAARSAARWDAEPPADPADLSGLMRLLSWYDDHLGRAKQRLVLALDEYEQIDAKIGEGVFGPDLLATFRESIQSHRNVTWVFAGSHEIAELAHAEWPSYLVSARTVEVLPFTPAETRQLLTDPMRHSRLWRDEAKRPRFAADFWGADGIDRIHADAGGWPHLVQLIAETAVDVVNAEGATAVTDEMYGRVRAKAVVRGDTVLRQLLLGEVESPGEREYLTRFRKLDDQPPPDDEAVERSIRRRLLVEAAGGRWRLRVPLMQQWLRDRG